jgi:plasmanylethanolamine desaturase
MNILTTLLQAIATIVIADFFSGFFHWLEDAYGHEDFPVTGRLFTVPNILHHHNPRYFVRHSWLQSSWDLALFCALIVFVAWLFGLLSWQVWLLAILGANANQIHKWAHRSRHENGPLISFLHDCRLVQSPAHHAGHHTNPKSSHYCVLTDFVNPVLDRIGFWGGLERLVAVLFSVSRRVDTSIPHDNVS